VFELLANLAFWVESCNPTADPFPLRIANAPLHGVGVQIQSVMMRDMKSCASSRPAPAAELGKLAIDAAVAEAATKLVEKVLDSCSQVSFLSNVAISGVRSSFSLPNLIPP